MIKGHEVVKTHFTEVEILRKLESKYKDDFELMAKDVKINKLFWTEGEIKRKLKKLQNEN